MAAAKPKTTPAQDRELAKTQAERIDEEIKKAEYRYDGDDAFLKVRDAEFKLAEELSLMAAAKMSLMADDDDDLELETLYLMLQSLIADEDWKKFERYSIQKRVSPEEIVSIIAGGLEAISGRPTKEPSGS